MERYINDSKIATILLLYLREEGGGGHKITKWDINTYTDKNQLYTGRNRGGREGLIY